MLFAANLKAYAALCQKVTASKAAIEANNARIEVLKADDDDKVVEKVVETVEDVAEAVEEKVEEVIEEIKND